MKSKNVYFVAVFTAVFTIFVGAFSLSNATAQERDRQGNPDGTVKDLILERIKQIARETEERRKRLEEYDTIGDFDDGFVAVELNGKWGFIDETGKEILPPEFENLGSSDALFFVQLDGKWGCIDKMTGKVVVELKYEDVLPTGVRDGLAPLKLKGKWGFIDEITGKEVVSPKYDKVRHISRGTLFAVNLNDKWGFIDKTGKEVIELKYDELLDFDNGLAMVKLNNKWGFIDKTGKEVDYYSECKKILGWNNGIRKDAQIWWIAFEKANANNFPVVIELAKELIKRGATIENFFDAYTESKATSVPEILEYLDDMTMLEPKPVLTVSIASPETLYKIAERIATLTGTLDEFNNSTLPFRELKGINPELPLIVVFLADGSNRDSLLFLPITDPSKVELPGIGNLLSQSTETANGKYLIEGHPIPWSFVLTQKKDYLVVSSKSSKIKIPDDPAIFIEGMEQFTLGIRLDTENTWREVLKEEKTKEAMWLPFKFFCLVAIQDKIFEQIISNIEKIVPYIDSFAEAFNGDHEEGDTRSITWGISMEAQTGDVNLRITDVVKPDSDLQKLFAFDKGVKTKFSGFAGDENAVLSFSGSERGSDPDEMELFLDAFIEHYVQIRGFDENLGKSFVGKFFDFYKKFWVNAVSADIFDLGCSMGNDGTFVLGVSLADDKAMEDVGEAFLNYLKDAMQNDEKFEECLEEIELNYTTFDGFQMSKFVFPSSIPDKTLYVYWGLKHDAFVLLGGFDPKSEGLLKLAIISMNNPVDCPNNIMRFSLHQFGRLLENFQNDQTDSQQAAVVRAFLDAEDDAEITFSCTCENNTEELQLFISGKIWQAIASILHQQ